MKKLSEVNKDHAQNKTYLWRDLWTPPSVLQFIWPTSQRMPVSLTSHSQSISTLSWLEIANISVHFTNICLASTSMLMQVWVNNKKKRCAKENSNKLDLQHSTISCYIITSIENISLRNYHSSAMNHHIE